MGMTYCRLGCFCYVTWNRNQTSAAYVESTEVRALASAADTLASLCKLSVTRRSHGWSSSTPTACVQAGCTSVWRRRWRLTSVARAAFRVVLLERGGCRPYLRFGQVVGYLVMGQMSSGDGFISTFRDHFGLWAVTKFGVTRRLTVSLSGNTGTFRDDG